MSEAETQLRDMLLYLREAAFAASSGAPIDEEDREILNQARQDLHPDSQILRAVAGRLRSGEHPDYSILSLSRLLEAVLEVSSRGILTSPVWKYVKVAQAEAARAGRQSKKLEDPKEQAIEQAIQAATVQWDGKKRFKLAGIISADLKRRNVEITPRAISDRLEKWKLLKSFTDGNGSS